MKNKASTIKKEKEFDTVKTFREIKDKISEDLFDKSPEQIKAYLRKNSMKLRSE